jgi:hypothetical protein
MVPLSNFVTREAVPLRAQIDRVDEQRYFDVKAAVAPGLVSITDTAGQHLRTCAATRSTPAPIPTARPRNAPPRRSATRSAPRASASCRSTPTNGSTC